MESSHQAPTVGPTHRVPPSCCWDGNANTSKKPRNSTFLFTLIQRTDYVMLLKQKYEKVMFGVTLSVAAP